MMSPQFKVGDRVMFKADMEEYGRISKLYATAADVEVWNGDRGEYERHHVPYRKLSHDE